MHTASSASRTCKRAGVGFGIDGHRADAQPSRGAQDAARNFAAVRYQDALDHGHYILKMP